HGGGRWFESNRAYQIQSPTTCGWAFLFLSSLYSITWPCVAVTTEKGATPCLYSLSPTAVSAHLIPRSPCIRWRNPLVPVWPRQQSPARSTVAWLMPAI